MILLCSCRVKCDTLKGGSAMFNDRLFVCGDERLRSMRVWMPRLTIPFILTSPLPFKALPVYSCSHLSARPAFSPCLIQAVFMLASYRLPVYECIFLRVLRLCLTVRASSYPFSIPKRSSFVCHTFLLSFIQPYLCSLSMCA